MNNIPNLSLCFDNITKEIIFFSGTNGRAIKNHDYPLHTYCRYVQHMMLFVRRGNVLAHKHISMHRHCFFRQWSCNQGVMCLLDVRLPMFGDK